MVAYDMVRCSSDFKWISRKRGYQIGCVLLVLKFCSYSLSEYRLKVISVHHYYEQHITHSITVLNAPINTNVYKTSIICISLILSRIFVLAWPFIYTLFTFQSHNQLAIVQCYKHNICMYLQYYSQWSS